MKPRLKSLTPSGKRLKSLNRFSVYRLYLIVGLIALLLFVGVYTQVLIRNAKRDEQFVPRLFAQYIAYTDSYLKKAEENTQLLTEVLVQYLSVAGDYNYQEKMWTYLNTEFMPRIKIPIIITDNKNHPTAWYHISVPDSVSFAELNEEDQQNLMQNLATMISIPIRYRNQILGYAYFQRPISFQEFLKKIDYSIIVTDRTKIPLYWRNIDLPENKSYNDLSLEQQIRLRERTKDMYEIPITNESDSLGYVYFTSSPSLARIPYLIYLELFLAAFVIFFAFYGFMLLRRSEKDSLWIGLAKETAHQFGTPITSLVGWVDYLKAHPHGFQNEAEFDQLVEWMEADLNKLKDIASRFGKVGSTIKLEPCDLDSQLSEIVDYYKERLPHQSSKIEISYTGNLQGAKVMMDADLFKWTMENLIKNCIDAIGVKGGNITITAIAQAPRVYIHVKDEGKGIPHSMWKKVFEPGITTKNRGWGLGLSLAKRIVEEYHQGRIRVIESSPGEGTTIEIMLHMYQENKEGK
ncbi:MAG TPA: HAMP domain-containing sensor histidine kinase [Candidatus Cloacimonadota bacterium]|nr:HAMP domain-containing sensor histidine kinase [Candidatus Cloacimonadota bacterium]